MKKLTALLTVLALAMITGSAIAAEMRGGDVATAPMASSFELRKQLSPNVFGYIADGVSEEEFRGTIDTHYGVAPAWKTDEPLTMIEKAEKDLRGHLSPNVFGYVADGVRVDEYRGPIDTHYGIAPTWEDRTEGSVLGKELRKQLAPKAFENIDN